MWVYLAIMVLSYLMQDPQTDAERKNALLKSAALTAGTYYVANETEWGKSTFGGTWLDTGSSAPVAGATMPDGTPAGVAATGAGSWLASNATPLLVGAAGGAAASGLLGKLQGLTPFLLIGGLGYMLLRPSQAQPTIIVQKESK